MSLIFACKKEKASSYFQDESNSGFKTYEQLCGTNFYERDTFYLHLFEINANGYRTLQITCSADDTTALSYKWTCSEGTAVDSVGLEAIFSFNPDSVSYGTIRAVTISLVTISQNNQKDSTTKTIFIKKNPVPWLGQFNGHNIDNPSDTFSIFLTRTDQYGIACCSSYTVKNLPNGLNTYVKIPDIQSAFDFTLNNDCEPYFYDEITGYTISGPKGFGNYADGNIVIDYYYLDPVPDVGASSVIQKTFVGIKVQ